MRYRFFRDKGLIKLLTTNNRKGKIMANTKAKKKPNLIQQANEILRLAETSGVQSNFFFTTTFKRYQRQIKMLDGLEEAMDEKGMFVSKEYIKGSKNLYTNPAVAEFNRTTDSANKTVVTLMKIIKEFNVDGMTDDEDLLMKTINGSGDDE